VLVLELTNHFENLMVPTLLAVVGATVLSRRLGAHSIYSARLASGDVMESSPSATAASAASVHSLNEALPGEFTAAPEDDEARGRPPRDDEARVRPPRDDEA